MTTVKNIRSLIFVALAGSLFCIACSKDSSSLTQGKMIVKINNKSDSYVATATKTTGSVDGKSYVIVTITGINASITTLSQNTVVLIITAPTLEKKTYNVPVYTISSTPPNPLVGFASGKYSTYESSQTIIYASEYIENTTGSITITDFSDNSLKGTYEMTLASMTDKTKKISISGSFESNFLPGTAK
jgi:hypothetical protein